VHCYDHLSPSLLPGGSFSSLTRIRRYPQHLPMARELQNSAMTARTIVDELYEKHSLYYDVIEGLKIDTTRYKSVRKVALQITNSRKVEDAEEQNEAEQ
jgi:hypothetical protein